MDECIPWRDHIDQVAKKAAKGIGLMRRSKDLLNTNTLKAIYDALVLPHFDYCALVYDNCSKTLQTKLQKLQNKAARILTCDSYKTPSDAVRAKLEWETLLSRREKQMNSLMVKVMQGDSSNYLQELFTISCNKTYNLRSNNRVLSLPKPNTNALKRSFSYQGAAAWNDLKLG